MRIMEYTNELHDKVIKAFENQFVGIVKKGRDKYCFYLSIDDNIRNITMCLSRGNCFLRVLKKG